MKQLLLLFLLLCSASVMRAQDVIVKKDGSTILSKVLEVGENEVKYKRFDNLNGPTYTISKSELQAINYQNGAKDTFSTPKREENRYLPNNQNDGTQQYNDRALLALDASNHNNPYRKAKTIRTIGWIGCPIFLIAAIGIGSLVEENVHHNGSPSYTSTRTNGFALAGAIVCAAAGIGLPTYCMIKSHNIKKQANMLQSSTIYQYDFKMTNGSSLSASLDMINDHSTSERSLGLGLRYNF